MRIGFLVVLAMAWMVAGGIGAAEPPSTADIDTADDADEAGTKPQEPYFSGREYRIDRGDTLWGLADRYYVIPYYWPHIWNRNEALSNPNRLDVDQMLWLPALEGRPGDPTAADRRSISAGYLRLYEFSREQEGFETPADALIGIERFDPSLLPESANAPVAQPAATEAGTAVAAPADAGDEPAGGRATGPGTAAAAAGPGVPIGSFRLNLGASLSRSYEDNLFATRTDTESAWSTTFGPWLSLESDWDRHALALRASAETADYTSNEDEDYTDRNLRLQGRYDLAGPDSLFGSLTAAREHEERGAVNVPGAAAEPTVYRDRQAVLGTALRLGGTELRLGVTGRELDFEDVRLVGGGVANNDDRDRDERELGGRLTWLRPQGWQAFVQGAADDRAYDQERDDFGFERSSTGAAVAVGATREIAGGYAELFAGYMEQDYDDPAFAAVQSPDYGLRLDAALTGRTRLRLAFDRSIEETTLPGVPATLDSVASATLEHRMTPRASFSVPAYWLRSDFEQSERTDDVTGVGLTLSYRMTRHLSLYAGHAFERRESTEPSADYEQGTTYAGIAAELEPGPIPPLPGSNASGPYAGLQVGSSLVGTELAGPRGPAAGNGTLEAEFGNRADVAGGFVGYGWSQARWLLGLELETDTGDSGWDHERAPGGNTFFLSRERSYAVSARLGYWLARDALLYGRAGLARTEFDASYEAGSGGTADVEDTPRGVRFGAGVELALGEHWFGRLDWSHTDYHPIDVDYGTGSDEFSPEESILSLGLGYRFFDGGAGRAPARDPSSLTGPYLGAALGWGNLHTDNEGDARGRTATGTLSVDRADSGLALAGFGGYGRRVGRLYLGIELEAERSDADWGTARLPDRRVYGVERGPAYGLALRIGHVTDGGTLVYLRGGRVHTRFETDYAFAGEGVDIDDERSLWATRAGFGVEIPASGQWFVRADYSYTDYDEYAIDYGSGTEVFDNDEDTFRLGLGYRF